MNRRPGPALRPCSKRDPGGDRSQEPSSLEAALPGAEGASNCSSAGSTEHELWTQKPQAAPGRLYFVKYTFTLCPKQVFECSQLWKGLL